MRARRRSSHGGRQYGAQRGTTYGYLWWVAQPPATVAIFAWGHGGQFAYVVPSLDLVVVATTQWQGLSAETECDHVRGHDTDGDRQ